MSPTRGDDLWYDEHRRLALDAARMGMWSWDTATDVVVWDSAMEACFGLEPGEFGGTFNDFVARIPEEDRAQTLDVIIAAQQAGIDLEFEHHAVWPDGSVHWIEGRGRSVFAPDGTLVGMVGVGIDIDDRKRLEEMQVEAAALRANAELAEQLEDAERIARIGSWRWLFATDELTLSAEMRRQLGVDAPRTGVELFSLLEARVHPEDRESYQTLQAEAYQQERPVSVEHRVVVRGQVRHLVHRSELVHDDAGQIIGLRGTTQDVTERHHAEQTLLATRERLAKERRAVEVLHETLLPPELPAVPGFEMAARYLSAEVEADVGGDWYDAFPLPDGRVMLVVGDVSGHGIRAAQLMAKLRHAARAYATLDPRPADMLAHLDAFLGHFCEPEEFATVQLAALDPDSGQVEMVSAGHPYPVLVRDDGTAFVAVDGSRVVGVTMLPLEVETECFTLEPGEAIVFYTDGLVERHGRALAERGEGTTHILQLTKADADEGAEQLCDTALARCLAGVSREDDVCVLALVRQPVSD